MNRHNMPIARSSAQTKVAERRQHFRHDGAGLVVECAGERWPVADISIGGFGLHGLDRPVGDRFRLILARVGTSDGIACECEVAGRDGGLARLVFTRPTLPLLRLVVAHVSALTGVAPHLLKLG